MPGEFSRRGFLRGSLATTGFAAVTSYRVSATRELSNTIRIEADGGGFAAYEFTVSGSLSQQDDDDHVRGNRAYGHLGPKRGTDTFDYSGQITGFVLAGPATVYNNGSAMNTRSVPHPAGAITANDFPSAQGTNTIRIESDGGGIGAYEFGVTGSLNQVDNDDQVRGNRAYGHLGPERGTDEFRYTGTVSSFRLAGPASVFHNGSEVRAGGNRGGGNGNQGGGNQGDGNQGGGGNQSNHELCIHAPNDRLYPYQFAVGGNIDKLETPQMASIDPNAVTRDPEDDIDDCKCNGFTRGGWDCYAFTGDLLAFSVPEQWAGKYDLRLDGQRVTVSQLVTNKEPSEVSCGGGGRPDCQPVENDVMLVLDRSGSMEQPTGKFNQAQSGATNLIDLLATNDRVGLVSFADGVTMDAPLTGNFSRVQSAIRRLNANGGTNLRDAVTRARTELVNGGRSNANKIMVVLADGEHNVGGGDPVREARKAKSAGIRVMTYGIPPLTDKSQLRRMATDPPRDNFFNARDVESVNDVFDKIAQRICQ